jgi:ribosomal protein L5
MAKTKKPIVQEKKVDNNAMRAPVLEKVVLNCGGTAEKLEKSVRLLGLITKRKIKEITSQKRIPSFGVRPGLKTGCMVTIRGPEKEALLKRLFGAVGNKILKKKIEENHFSFGIKEYLEIPDMEYQRDIGILGLDVTAVFKRKGKRVGLKKIKSGKVPVKQNVTPEEIISYLQNKLQINVEESTRSKEE